MTCSYLRRKLLDLVQHLLQTLLCCGLSLQASILCHCTVIPWSHRKEQRRLIQIPTVCEHVFGIMANALPVATLGRKARLPGNRDPYGIVAHGAGTPGFEGPVRPVPYKLYMRSCMNQWTAQKLCRHQAVKVEQVIVWGLQPYHFRLKLPCAHQPCKI